mmetsp:Transcript_3306/g.6013  ORF Transcript_3306/g.6013 Transcript_3306/m.6013 type:complete len:167 (-) Transcript_3306:4340-4840(-)
MRSYAVSAALTVLCVPCAAALTASSSDASSKSSIPSRRSFFSKVVPSVALVVTGSVGWFVGLDGDHSADCICQTCIRFGPGKAMAYERDVGGEGRSSESYAMNLQARETNARLERDGFKLDTKEEEAKRLSDAFATFSYEPTGDGKNTKGGKKKNSGASNSKSSAK